MNKIFTLSLLVALPLLSLADNTVGGGGQGWGDTGDNTTKIDSVKVEKPVKRDVIYDLNGRRLSQPPAKGVYILNGKLKVNN